MHPLLAAVHPLLAAVHPLLAAVHPLLAAVHPLLAAVHPLLAAVHVPHIQADAVGERPSTAVAMQNPCISMVPLQAGRTGA